MSDQQNLEDALEQVDDLAQEVRMISAQRDLLQDLLIRYIKHVRACEGVDFIESGAHHNQDSFDELEWGILKDLAK